MLAIRSASSSSQTSSYSSAPRSRIEVAEDRGPVSHVRSGVEWRGQHATDTFGDSDGTTGPSKEGLVEDTLAAFRGILDRADGTKSGTDLAEEAASRETTGRGLNYFAPAFRQVLREENADEIVADEDDKKRASLEYFASAFRRVCTARGEGVESSDSEHEEKTEESESATSLDYFTPALRTFLDREESPPVNSGNSAQESDSDTVSLDYFAPALP